MNYSFASDNSAPIHSQVLAAIQKCNDGFALAYGNDRITETTLQLFKNTFGEKSNTYFVFNGTGANVIALQALTQSHHAIICTDTSHINVDECGAPEKFTGCKLITVPHTNGKLSISKIENALFRLNDQHAAQPKVVSISQSTEYGTVYSLRELSEISQFCRKNNLFLHIDGARFSNASASLNVSLKELATQSGADIISFGGTKNGLMLGEAIVVINEKLNDPIKYIRKQSMQLSSKMRYISAQFSALLNNDLWLQNAKHANQMAQLLAESLKKSPQIRITQPVDANAIFAVMPNELIHKLSQEFKFYIWNEKISEIRLMTSFATTRSDIEMLTKLI